MAEIEPRKNGPLKVTGDFVLRDAEGNAFDLSGQTVIFLCRCGQSGNKPFCDGTHKKTGFEAPGIEPPRK